jgi:PAS domain S-box-containing protein
MTKTPAAPHIFSRFSSKWDRSISFRFLSIVSGILIVSSVMATCLIGTNVNSVLERFLVNKAKNLASYVAKLSKDPMLSDNRIQLDAIVGEAIKDDDIVYAYIQDAKGQILTSQFASIDYAWLQKNSILLNQPQDATIPDIISAIKAREGLQEVSTLIQIGDQSIGKITVGISERRIDAQTFRTVLFILGLSITASLAIGAILFAVSRKMILDPIKELAGATAALAKAGLHTQVEIKASGEVKMLVEAFNQMAEDLRKTTFSKEYVDNIIGSMNDTLIVIATDGGITRMNGAASRLLGYEEHELIGQPIDVIFGEQTANKRSILDDLKKTGNLSAMEKVYVSKKGMNVPVFFSASEIRTGSTIQGYVCVAKDITERKQAERKLVKAQAEQVKNHEVLKNLYSVRNIQAEELEKAYSELKMTQAQMIQHEKLASIGQLAAGVAHEINNPVGFINSNLGTLGKYVERILAFMDIQTKAIGSLEDRDLEEELAEQRKKLKLDYILKDIREVVVESQEGVERVRKIVDNLKMFSRKDEEAKKESDINAGLESTINVVWNELKYKATLHKRLGNIPQFKCHPGQLNQVFMNLLVNASHAIDTKGEITVQTSAENGNILVSISDTGCGIPESIIPRIFEPFFTTKEAGKGTGLGLSISYDIVKKHHGEMTVESTVGEGTTFRITLPVA